MAAPASSPAAVETPASDIIDLTAPAPPAAVEVVETPVPPQPSNVLLQTPAASQGVAQAPGGKQYTGHPISLDFQGADLRAVLRTFAEISGLNVVIDPAVQGSVDVALRDVPWDQALDIILRANKLGYSVDGTIVRVAPLTVLADEEKQRRQLAEQQALAGELQVMTATLSYATAEQVRPLLLKSALTQRGTRRIRRAIEHAHHLRPAGGARPGLLAHRDAGPRPAAGRDRSAHRHHQQVVPPRNRRAARSGRRDVAAAGQHHAAGLPELDHRRGPNRRRQPTPGAPNGVNLGVPGATSALGLALGAVNGAFNLDVALTALESEGKLSVISTPRVSTQNNVEAEIAQGTQIPIQTVANNTVTVTFKDAALVLRVTPQITAANTVIMKIALENAQADFGRSVNGIPPIDTQRANTSVLVGDGQTTVIGGIYFSSQEIRQGRTPVLHKVPLLGWLFRNDLTNNQNNELLIFITPRILKS